MGARAQALADRFEQANADVVATVERCSEAQWRTACAGEEWPVGVVAHHVASSHGPLSGLVKTMAAGQPLPGLTMDMIHQGNAAHAKEHANCSKEDTLRLLREGGRAAATTIRGLSDEQLDRSGTVVDGMTLTAEQLIERILIGHPQSHLGSIRQATGL